MYGYKGAKRDNCVYPTVRNIRETFYGFYPGVELDSYDPAQGYIPIVGEKFFRYVQISKW